MGHIFVWLTHLLLRSGSRAAGPTVGIEPLSRSHESNKFRQKPDPDSPSCFVYVYKQGGNGWDNYYTHPSTPIHTHIHTKHNHVIFLRPFLSACCFTCEPESELMWHGEKEAEGKVACVKKNKRMKNPLFFFLSIHHKININILQYFSFF